MTEAGKQLDLFDALEAQEGFDLEFKKARDHLPGDLWETYSAFANTDGGTIYLGVSQKGDDIRAVGVSDPDRLLKDFWSTVNNRGKVSHCLVTNKDVTVIPMVHGGNTFPVIAILVPRASRRERPVYVGQDPFSGTYRRNHEGDYKCTRQEVERMFADRSDEPADHRILKGFGMADLDPLSLKQYRNRFASRYPDHAWLAEDDKGLLQKLGGWSRDRSTGHEGLTVAGLLMFGKHEAITDKDAVPSFHLDYREHLTDDPNIRWTDRLTFDGTWEANLFQFYQRVISKLGTGPGIKVPFELDAEGYRKPVTPVHEALQEALVNALIHADHFGQGGVVIERWADKLEFSNPGTLLVSHEQLLQGGISECRNKALQRMFQMLGVGDKAGSGIDKIKKSWSAQRWASPKLKENLRPDRVLLVLPMVSMLPEAVLEVLRGRFGELFDQLDGDEVQALVYAHEDEDVTNQDLQDMLNLHRTDITKLLKGLVRKGLLKAKGVGRGTRYVLEGGISPDNAAISPNKSGISPNKGGISPNKGGISPNKTGISHDKMTMPLALDLSGDTTHTGTPAFSDIGSGSPAVPGARLSPELLKMAEIIRSSKRADRSTMRQTILALCSGRYLSLDDLARLLGRQQEGIRDGYVSPMYKEGLLERRYPDKPNHRDQAYRTIVHEPEQEA
ncbi:MAG: putative DNA binding domain-containing protein [Flavobacteriales bacterium]|nr:putative DNA binding domain-containing protein [Flavobacteriales bacterium]